MCQSEGTRQIVMSFSPPVVGFLLKRGGGGHGHPRPPPGYALEPVRKSLQIIIL